MVRNMFLLKLEALTSGDIIGMIESIKLRDVIDTLLVIYLVYKVLQLVRETRAMQLVKGLLLLTVLYMVVDLFELNTMRYLLEMLFQYGVIALLVVFQPELRRALESLGRKNFITSIFNFDSQKDQLRFSEKTVAEITKASLEMAKVKTGALIVVEQDMVLTEFERTGIMLDSLVSSQLLINIFEHNTPLHDGAVIIRGNRIVSATCYLPLSDNMGLSKDLGTRHRAAVGVSEVSDALVVVVSEETGNISAAIGGELFRNLDAENLKRKLGFIQNRSIDTDKFRLWRRRRKNGQKTDEASGK